MYSGNKFYICVTIIAFFHFGECLKCYECLSDSNRNDVPTCWEPFHPSGGVKIVEQCPGLCLTIHASGSQISVGLDSIVARACDPVGKDTCEIAKKRLEEIGASVRHFDCSTCNEDLCNSAISTLSSLLLVIISAVVCRLLITT